MPFKFNPFSGNFDQTGSGGDATVFDGEVQFFSDLPQTVGTPTVNSAYFVRESEGTVWFGNKKQKGIYIRSGNSGVRNDDWTYGGEYPVTSVNGATGAVTVAAAQHATEHEAGEADEIQAMAAIVTTDDASLNGIYVPNASGTTSGGRLTLYKTGTRQNTKLEYNQSLSIWRLIKNAVVQLSGQQANATYAWTTQQWLDERSPQVLPNGGTVTRAGLEVLARRAADGTSNVATATTSEDGLLSSADKTKLNGIAANATANTASSATPSALGTASAGSATDYARADHTHSAEVSDSAFRVTGSTDATKKIALEVDTNVPSGQTVTLTAPSSGGTIALAGAAPAAHAASHAAGGSDPVTLQLTQVAAPEGGLGPLGGGETLYDYFASAGNIVFSNTEDFAAASHTHELTALAATGATNGHVLTANGSNGATFAALPASGVTGAASSASDVLGVSGASITGVDAGSADRLVFWDDSANKLTYLEAGSGLSISGTTLTASGGLNAMQSIAINFVLN